MLNVCNYLKEQRISTLSPEQLGARLVLAVTLVHLELFLLLTHKCTFKHIMLYHTQSPRVFHHIFPHPFQKASPHALWCLQATLQILEEDPARRNQEEHKRKLDQHEKTERDRNSL